MKNVLASIIHQISDSLFFQYSYFMCLLVHWSRLGNTALNSARDLGNGVSLFFPFFFITLVELFMGMRKAIICKVM